MSDDVVIPASKPDMAQKRRDNLAKARQARTAKRAASARTAPERTASDVRHTIEPAAPAARTIEAALPDEPFVRRRRDERQVSGMDVPKQFQKPGRSYQWVTISVLNQPVDPSDIQDFRMNGGWVPERARDHAWLLGDTVSPDAPVEAKGQRLMSRPVSLTMEAREEDVKIARQMQAEKMRAAAGGQSAVRGEAGLADQDRRIVRPVSLEVSLEGVAG